MTLRLDLENIEVGSLIDVRDTANIWCEARVLEIHRNSLTRPIQTVLKVHYLGWDPLFDEFISSNSFRLANHRHFTRRRGTAALSRHHPIRERRRRSKDAGKSGDQPQSQETAFPNQRSWTPRAFLSQSPRKYPQVTPDFRFGVRPRATFERIQIIEQQPPEDGIEPEENTNPE